MPSTEIATAAAALPHASCVRCSSSSSAVCPTHCAVAASVDAAAHCRLVWLSSARNQVESETRATAVALPAPAPWLPFPSCSFCGALLMWPRPRPRPLSVRISSRQQLRLQLRHRHRLRIALFSFRLGVQQPWRSLPAAPTERYTHTHLDR